MATATITAAAVAAVTDAAVAVAVAAALFIDPVVVFLPVMVIFLIPFNPRKCP